MTQQKFTFEYYKILAGGVRAKLLESAVNIGLFDMFENQSRLSQTYIIKTLELNEKRARKWLHFLCTQKFLDKINMENDVHYQLGDLGKAVFIQDKNEWWACKAMVKSWEMIDGENMQEVLRGAKVKHDVPWPPRSESESVFIEEWMRKTSNPPLHAMLQVVDFGDIEHILDVGGGDGSIGCGLAKSIPDLKVTVFNLPESIKLAKQNIEMNNLVGRVNVYEGNFLTDDAFPTGFDAILFSRVLWDWSPETTRKLLKMAYQALPKYGQVIICETFLESTQEFSLAFEYRYLYWDDLEEACFKTTDEYKAMLTEIGFELIEMKDVNNSAYVVLTAHKLA